MNILPKEVQGTRDLTGSQSFQNDDAIGKRLPGDEACRQGTGQRRVLHPLTHPVILGKS